MSLISLTLEEFETVDHLKRYALVAQGEFEFNTECVYTIEDRIISGPASARVNVGGNPGGNILGLVLVRLVADHSNGHSQAVFGIQAFFFAADVVRYKLGGHMQYPLRAAVVAFQVNDADIGIVAFEL